MPLPERSPLATYLGDGLYADAPHGDIVITSENGINVLDRIVLEPEVFVALLRFAARVWDVEIVANPQGTRMDPRKEGE